MGRTFSTHKAITYWKQIFIWKLVGKRELGRPKWRYKDNIKMDVRMWTGFNWHRTGFVGWVFVNTCSMKLVIFVFSGGFWVQMNTAWVSGQGGILRVSIRTDVCVPGNMYCWTRRCKVVLRFSLETTVISTKGHLLWGLSGQIVDRFSGWVVCLNGFS
jgi:hypothetical protein